MKRTCDWLKVAGLCVAYAAAMSILPGCNSSPPAPAPNTASSAGHDPDAGAGHDHEHGHKHDHHHAEHGPHKGTLVVLNSHKNHLELVLDAETGKLTGYVLCDEAKDAVSIKQEEIVLGVALPGKDKDDLPEPFEVKLAAVKPSETGEASEFAVESEKLKGVKEFDAVLSSIKIGDKEEKEVKFNFPKGNEDHHH
jgi:hypothetical protein